MKVNGNLYKLKAAPHLSLSNVLSNSQLVCKEALLPDTTKSARLKITWSGVLGAGSSLQLHWLTNKGYLFQHTTSVEIKFIAHRPAIHAPLLVSSIARLPSPTSGKAKLKNNINTTTS